MRIPTEPERSCFTIKKILTTNCGCNAFTVKNGLMTADMNDASTGGWNHTDVVKMGMACGYLFE
jgi:hypothetical protein